MSYAWQGKRRIWMVDTLSSDHGIRPFNNGGQSRLEGRDFLRFSIPEKERDEFWEKGKDKGGFGIA